MTSSRTLLARLGVLESRRPPAGPIRSKAERDAAVAAFLADPVQVSSIMAEMAENGCSISPSLAFTTRRAVLAVAGRADT